MLVDTHAHLDFKQFNSDLDDVIKRAKAKKVERVINVGADLKGSKNSVKLAKEYDFISASIGVHPHNAKNFNADKLTELERLAKNNRSQVVAVGEMGLDYHYDNSPRQKQREVFIKQLELAKKLDLPVIIHSRDAKDDTLEILREHAQGLKGVLHCYVYDLATAREVLDLGFHLAFGGILTFNNQSLKEVIKNIDLDRVLFETDAPYLTPTPYRGKRNEPAYVYHVVEYAAKILEMEVDDLAGLARDNAQALFNY